MDSERVVRDNISAHIDAAAAALETQAGNLAAAAARMVRCLLEERRLFVCGSGGSGANAQHFAVKMLGRLERERPGLPVFCLSDGAPQAIALAGLYGTADVFARPLRALGQAGDVLLVLSATGMSPSSVQAVIAAHDRGMDVVALTGHEGGDIARVLADDDIELRVAVSSPARAEEIHLLLINVLCDLLERELFGDLP